MVQCMPFLLPPLTWQVAASSFLVCVVLSLSPHQLLLRTGKPLLGPKAQCPSQGAWAATFPHLLEASERHPTKGRWM